MKNALVYGMVLLCCSRLTLAGTPALNLTVVVDFKGSHSIRSETEMQQETQKIIQDAGIHLIWRTADQASRNEYSDIVVVKIKGACMITPDPNIYDELGPPPGPYAFTWVTNGEVQPFAEVACDRVAAAIRSAMWGGDYGKSDVLLGRALGRVLAHEIVHMLTHSGGHEREGVAKAALSGNQLIGKSLLLSPAELDRLKQELTHR